MIIKSKTRKVPSFRQLLNYMLTETKEPAFVLTQNVIGSTVDEWVRSFRMNEQKRRRKTKNSVVIYHEIVSLSDIDNSKVSNEVLLDLAKRYLRERHIQAMIVIVGHRNTDCAHFHVCMSGVEFGTGKATTISRSDFEALKLRMEDYQRERYPTLKSVDHDRGIPYLTPNTTKAKLREIMTTINPEYWREYDIDVYYYRGKAKGVVYGGRKYRFRTLGLDEQVLERQLEVELDR